jgi:hypothetical protein
VVKLFWEAWNEIDSFPVQQPWFQLFALYPLQSGALSLSIRNESRPASLVMAVTDF